MKIIRRISPSQLKRVKIMSLLTVSILCFQMVMGALADLALKDVAEDKWEMKKFEGQYVWHATQYKKFLRQEASTGYIEEYTNKDTFCHSSILVPGASLMNEYFMGVIYLLILFYFFLGIAIVSDLFMEAIEVITSKKTVVSVEDPNQPGKMIDVERNVWNPTIANLTLMALGSSMPEILLSVFSTVLDLDGVPSALGPASIVGSAAFNLFVISAVSIAAVGLETKKIFDVRVFIWTAVASTWAYVWFFLVLTVITPNYVDLWEAILTFCQFIILCIVAYGCDRWTGSTVLQAETSLKLQRDSAKLALRKVAETIGVLHVVEMGMDRLPKGCKLAQKDQVQEQFKIVLGQDYLAPITNGNLEDNEEGKKDEVFDQLMEALQQDSLLERMVYKKEAAKNITGFKRAFVKPKVNTSETSQFEDKRKATNPSSTVSFASYHYSVNEKAGKVEISILKKCDEKVEMRVITRQDTAVEEKDFTAIDKEIILEAGEKETKLSIDIKYDDACTPDKDFFVCLMDAKTGQRIDGDDTECRVTIIDCDEPGVIGFNDRMTVVRPRDKVMFLEMTREKGADGEVSCEVTITTDSPLLPGKAAKSELDFQIPNPYIVTFQAGESVQKIRIDMPGTSVEEEIEAEKDNHELTKQEAADSALVLNNTQKISEEPEDEAESVHFIVELKNPTGSAKLSKKKSCFVEIRPQSQATDEAVQIEQQNMLKHFMLGENPTWGYQFMLAIQLGPTITEDGVIDDVTCGESIYHLLAVPWRLLFALIPPRHIWGGWAAFMVALSLIGVVTFVVGEIATLLGCAFGLKISVTAITLVALGTSLPDTFASQGAAINSKYADAAVGNVTGSNAVNVFLGMGLPWLIVTFYKLAKNGESANVPAGDLAFSVIVFLCCSMCCFAVLLLRRIIIGGELGGPVVSKYITAGICVGLWCIYIILCTLKAYNFIEIGKEE